MNRDADPSREGDDEEEDPPPLAAPENGPPLLLEDSMLMLEDDDEEGGGGGRGRRDAVASAVLMLDVSADSSTEGDAVKVLQSKSQLRKNLDLREFRRASVGPSAGAGAAAPGAANVHAAKGRPSVQNRSGPGPGLHRRDSRSSHVPVSDKIAHFESESKKNRVAMLSSRSPLASTTATIKTAAAADAEEPSVAAPALPPAGELPPHPRFQVMLRIRPPADPAGAAAAAATKTVKASSAAAASHADGSANALATAAAATTIEIVGSATVRTHPPPSSYAGVTKEYTFDRVLDPSLTQRQVYELAAAPLVPRVFLGGTVLLFCYGVTNAGKTYTVHGDFGRALKSGGASSSTSMAEGGDGSLGSRAIVPEPSWGILPRVLYDALALVQASSSTGKELRVSFFEIYQERFYDLLPDASPSAPAIPANPLLRKSLRLREDQAGNVAAKGLASHRVESMAQALRWMKVAKKNRVTCTNSLNQTSSRSHFVCQITVAPPPPSPDNGDMAAAHQDASSLAPPASFWVVDLAGSERGKRTGSSRGIVSQKEGSVINRSNMNLMHCLMCLREHPPSANAASVSAGSGSDHGSTASTNRPYKFPPHRNSQLTRLLMPHWSRKGNTVTAMIVNVNPAACDYDESQHVLSYANQAKNVDLDDSTAPGGAAGGEAAAKPAAVEYDENGRRVRHRPGGGGALPPPARTGVRAKVGKLLQKLSPKRAAFPQARGAAGIHKRKQAGGSESTKPPAAPSSSNKRLKTSACSAPGPSTSAMVSSAAKAPPPAAAPGTANVKASNAYKKLKMELVVAKTEIDMLTGEKRALEDKVEALEHEAEALERHLGNAELAIRNEVEFAIRNEVVAEVQEKWEVQRKEYEAIIAGLRQQVPSASLMKRPPGPPAAAALSAKVDELEDELKDRVEEIEELRGDLEDMELGHRRDMEAAHKEAERLRRELGRSREEAKNYKRLLQEDDGIEEDDEEEEAEESDEADDDDGMSEDDERRDEHRDTLEADPGRALPEGPSPGDSANAADTDRGDEEYTDDDDEEEDGEESRRATLVSEPALRPGAASTLASAELDSEDDGGEARRATLVSERAPPPEAPAPNDSASLPPAAAPAERGDGSDAAEYEEMDSMIATYFDEPEAVVKAGEESVAAKGASSAPGVALSSPLDASKHEKADGWDPIFPPAAGSSLGSAVAQQENVTNLFSIGMSPARPAKSITSTSPMRGSNRKPFGRVEENCAEDANENGGGGGSSGEQWLEPKAKAKIDPKTGKYKRPKGRMPSGVDSWDENMGKWRLSVA